ncbi:putative divalent heavy-metal cations transporter [Halovivax ruber XH-70]|uniref:Putative divalent heavy-metal cations transporter n=1 Tax=Halovivax ruber (strain DSM 18193 / JCM 13892 / XH-70) TaxID=797302 RepID=L0I7G4_HALRX|nr:divalent heavy-metal cations transporter [Halovivax ruber]AGB15510.1 putative divalent heavy-metal cations transporter [Halovivax ruber XH-70]
MTEVLVQAVSYTMLAVVAALVGGVIAIYRQPSAQMESNVQHFAAGVVFAAVAAELLPDVHTRAPSVVVIGFAIGVVTMLGVPRLGTYVERRGIGGKIAGAASLLVTVGIDMVIDGVLIGVAFLTEPATGVLIAVALAIEVLFLGVTGVIALPEEMGTFRKLAVPGSFGVLLLLGVLVGVFALSGVSGTPIALVLAFGSAALLYLVTEELLVKAQKVPETPTSTTLFFVGFLLIFLLDMAH